MAEIEPNKPTIDYTDFHGILVYLICVIRCIGDFGNFRDFKSLVD